MYEARSRYLRVSPVYHASLAYEQALGIWVLWAWMYMQSLGLILLPTINIQALRLYIVAVSFSCMNLRLNVLFSHVLFFNKFIM
jgi:hypothetical protein